MKTKQSAFRREEASEELQRRRADSPICLWFLSVSLNGKTTHPWIVSFQLQVQNVNQVPISYIV